MQEAKRTISERLFRLMLLIRRVEERVAKEYPTDKIKSPVHLSIGQEATAAGCAAALRKEDALFGTYRNHAAYIAKGGDLPRMIAELYGKVTGCGRGKSGSMHLVDVSAGVLSASAIVGTGISNAVGYALAMKMRKQDNVAVTFFGDGAVDEGCFYESLNYAALERLPVIFLCENNGYAIHSRQLDRQPKANITERANTIGVQAMCLDGNDALAVYEQVSKAVSALRHGHGGPFLFECMTYRWREHVGPYEDFDGIRRERAEAELWFEKDPIRRIETRIDAQVRAEIEAEVAREIDAAFAFAEAGAFPTAEELTLDVFKQN
jgi:TPP-dependent pyruvate/acetoin dehydrogenase alpha subunit